MSRPTAPSCSHMEYPKPQLPRDCLGLSSSQPIPLHPVDDGHALPLAAALADNNAAHRSIVFLHQNKAGGATVRGLLLRHGWRRNLTFSLYVLLEAVAPARPSAAERLANPKAVLERTVAPATLRGGEVSGPIARNDVHCRRPL